MNKNDEMIPVHKNDLMLMNVLLRRLERTHRDLLHDHLDDIEQATKIGLGWYDEAMNEIDVDVIVYLFKEKKLSVVAITQVFEIDIFHVVSILYVTKHITHNDVVEHLGYLEACEVLGGVVYDS